MILLPLTTVVAVIGFSRCRVTAVTPGGAMLGLARYILCEGCVPTGAEVCLCAGVNTLPLSVSHTWPLDGCLLSDDGLQTVRGNVYPLMKTCVSLGTGARCLLYVMEISIGPWSWCVYCSSSGGVCTRCVVWRGECFIRGCRRGKVVC